MGLAGIERLATAKRIAAISLHAVRVAMSKTDNYSKSAELETHREAAMKNWLAREALFLFGPESSLIAAQKPRDRFFVEKEEGGYNLYDRIWPSTLGISYERLNEQTFNLRSEVGAHREWSQKLLNADSEDVARMKELLRYRFCEAVNSMLSPMAEVRHSERFTVEYKDETYIVRDTVWPDVRFEIERVELLDGIDMENILLHPIDGSVNDGTAKDLTDEEEYLTTQKVKQMFEERFGPERAILHGMKPSERFHVRKSKSGFRVKDNCHLNLSLRVYKKDWTK
ncbi:MAG TPA: hypothetical protein VGO47_11290, partial [Chlamydiales bacterium]|nr:hypothetical protein [Chlamydiales bacterium]